MFDEDKVPVVLRKLTLKLENEEDDEGDPSRVRVCECTFRIPILDYERAARIRLPITGHCFGRDHLPLWGVHEVSFQPPEEKYTAHLFSAPDLEMPEIAALELATLKRVRVWRVNHEKRDLSLEFVTRHQLARGDAKDLAALLNTWELGTSWLSLVTIQIPLGFEPDEPEEREAPPAGARPANRRRTH